MQLLLAHFTADMSSASFESFDEGVEKEVGRGLRRITRKLDMNQVIAFIQVDSFDIAMIMRAKRLNI
jgi:hypothetical protein